MRLSVDILLNQAPPILIPGYYRKNIQNLIIEAFRGTPLYEKYRMSNKPKDFTFSLYLLHPRKHSRNELAIESNILTLHFSTSDYSYLMYLYNHLQTLKNFELFKGIRVEFQRVFLHPRKEIQQNQIVFKTLSPIAVRNMVWDHETNRYRNAGRKDGASQYLTIEDERFKDMLSASILTECQCQNASLEIDFNPEMVQRTMVQMKNSKNHSIYSIPASLGIFKVRANPLILQRLYDAGMGAHRSSGFGMLEVVG